DRNVDQYRSGVHFLEHGAGDEPRRRGAGDEYSADDQIGGADMRLDCCGGGKYSFETRTVEPIELCQPRLRAIEDGDVGAHTERYARRVGAYDTAAKYRNHSGCHSGHPTEENASPPCAISRQWAPTCTAMRPATSLIGASSGRRPLSSVTVS